MSTAPSCAEIPASRELPPFRLFAGDLEKPALDDRQYRVLQLQNGVKAVLVHDPAADKAAACLAVAVGHMYDPVSARPCATYAYAIARLVLTIEDCQIDAPGMAHFCEHMITKVSLRSTLR